MKNIFRALGASALALALGVGGAVLPATMAGAHTPTAAVSCSSLKIGGSSYDANKANTWSVTINGVTESGTFGTSFTKTFSFPQDGATSTWSYIIESWDKNPAYKKADSGTLTCGTPTVNAPIIDVEPATCDRDGYVPVWRNNPPAQNANGRELPGTGTRVYFNREPVAPGTVTATIQKIGAGFDPAYPNGTKVTGNTTQQLTIQAALGYQSADPDKPCFDRPEVPHKDDIVTVTEGLPNCDSKTVPVKTVTEQFHFAWNETTKSYDVTSTITEVNSTRPLTPAEVKDCTTVPDPIYSQTINTTIDCETELATEETIFYKAEAVWNDETLKYDFGTPFEIDRTSAVREASAEELNEAECPLPETPDPIVKENTVWDAPKCGDTEKHGITTITTETPTVNPETREVEWATTTVEVKVTKKLTEDELAELAKDCPIVTPPADGPKSLAITGVDMRPVIGAGIVLTLGLLLITPELVRRRREKLADITTA